MWRLFNFQFAIIISAVVISVAWFTVAALVDWELLTLGRLKLQTPREECIVIKIGFETQDRLMHAKLGFSMWLEKHHTYLHLVADEPAIRACVETKNSWEEVASQLSVAIQSACGMRIFGSRLGVVSCIAMSKKIDDEVNRFSQGDMTEATVKQAMATMKEACKDLGKDWTAPRASDGKIMYKYRGVDCLTKVTSHQQEALLKLIAEVRTRAINSKWLDPIWCECQLVEVNAAEKMTVAPSLLTDAKLVRKAAAELISGGSGAERRS